MEIITLEEQRQLNLTDLKAKKNYIDNYCVIKVDLTKIINLRNERCLKYEDVALFLGLEKTLYFRREKGQLNFSIAELKKLSIFGTSSLNLRLIFDLIFGILLW